MGTSKVRELMDMNNFDPKIVESLRSFFTAMRVWELACTDRHRQIDKGRGKLSGPEALAIDALELKDVFHKHCTTWDNPFRTGTFVQGSEYDPDGEKILSVEQEGDAATVYTEQTTSRPKNKYVYKLKRTSDGWRLLDEKYRVTNEGLTPWFL